MKEILEAILGQILFLTAAGVIALIISRLI